MAIAPDWERSREHMRAKFGEFAPRAEGGWSIPDSARQYLSSVKSSGWETGRFLHAFGVIDADKMIDACREGLVKWWKPFSAYAYFGDIDAVKKMHAAFTRDPGAGKAPDITSAMTWVAHPHALKGGDLRAPDLRILALMFEWGASATSDDGKYFKLALQTGNAENIRLFVDNGASLPLAQETVLELLKAGKIEQAATVQEALGLKGFYTRVDNDTLLETKYIREPGGVAAFRTLFNFRARRVSEVFESGAGNDARMAMTSTDFAHYDAHALAEAQGILEKLGGRPPDALNKARAKLGTKP